MFFIIHSSYEDFEDPHMYSGNYLSSIKVRCICFFIFEMQRQKIRQMKLSLTSSLPKCKPWPGVGQADSRARDSIQASHVSGRNPVTEFITCCLLEPVLQDMNQELSHPWLSSWEMGVPTWGFPSRPKAHS